MRHILLSGAVIFVVIAISRTLLGHLDGSAPPIFNVLLEALVASIVLAPLLRWLSGDSQTSTARDVPEADAMRDPDSNMLNTRGLTINLLETMALAERYEREFAVVMLGIDRLKDIQESHGEKAVVAAKNMIGDTLVETLRIPDRAGRFEHDQFMIILPETDSEGAKQIAQRVCSAIADVAIDMDGDTRQTGVARLTTSAGVAPFRSGDDPALIIERSQAALAEAQRIGVNQTVVLA